MTQQEVGMYMFATFVDWDDQTKIDELKKKFKKSIKKNLGTKKVSYNRLNSYMVVSVELKNKPNAEKRISAENALKSILVDYTNYLNKDFHDHLSYNGDTKMFKSSLNKLGKKDLVTVLKQEQMRVIGEVEKEVAKLVSYASISIWDFPGHESDRIVLPGMVVTLEGEGELNLTDSIDELLLANLANYFVPFSKEMMSNLVANMSRLINSVDSEVDQFEQDAYRITQSLIGSISGLQESLKLFRRQVNRLRNVVEETEEDLKHLHSKELDFWKDQLSSLNCDELLEDIELLNHQIVKVKPDLRLLLKESGSYDLDGYLESLIKVKALSNGFVQWVHRFSDLPFFSTTKNGIAYESVGGETYESKNPNAILESHTLFKLYKRGGSTLYALRGIDLEVNEGEFLMIHGPSGSGKTTLLNHLAGLDVPNRGTVFYRGSDLTDMKDKVRSKIRRENFSFIFQSYALLPHLTATENTAIPLDLGGLSKELKNDIQALLNDVGIGEYANHKPAHLSGGQMQRLGIARSLIGKPNVIFADEPTGDLDVETGLQVMRLLKRYHEETGVTIVMVTHDEDLLKYATRVINVVDGQIVA